MLADPVSPRSSVLYTKLEEDNDCGARMPIGGDPWTEDQMACLEQWIGALSPPAPVDTADYCADCECEPESTESCYTGVTATNGVGECVQGQRICSFQGEWGPCDGQVLPSVENCELPGDEDCDGSAPACSEVWSINIGTNRSQSFRSVATDSAGNVWVIGDFQDTVDFGTGPLTATGENADIVVVKYSSTGVPLFSASYGDSSNQYATKIHVDANDDVLLVGRAFGKIDFGGGLLDAAGTDDVFVAKLDSQGNHVWSRLFGGIDPDRAERIATDASGDVYLTGTFTGSADFGFGPVVSAGAREAFVVKLGGAFGQVIWSQIFSSAGDAYGFGIDVDPVDGAVYVAARFKETLSNQGLSVTSLGDYDVAVAKLSAVGVLEWLVSYGSPVEDRVSDLVHAETATGTGHLVLTGHTQGTLALSDTLSISSAGSNDVFVASLDLLGQPRWAQVYGDSDDQFDTQHETNTWLNLVADDDGSVWVGGSFTNGLPVGPVTLNGAGERNDLFLLQLDGDLGSYLGARQYGGNFTEYLLDFDVDGDFLVLGGRFSSRSGFTLGSAGPIRGAGSFDGFVGRVPK